MNKFKKIMLGALSALTLGLFVAVGTEVNATSVEYGSVLVSTTVYDGDTKTWDFTSNLPGAQVNLNAGDDCNGIVCYYTPGDGKVAIKNSSSNGFDTYADAIFMVPVPSTDSTGTVTRTGNNGDGRGLTFNGGDTADGGSGNISKLTKVDYTGSKGTLVYNFVSKDVISNPVIGSNVIEGCFLKFTVYGGELKTTGISVQLKDGTTTYGAASVLHTVIYMDGTTPLKTDDEAVDGSNISYTPKKYGYDFEGWYTDASLDSQYKVNTLTYTVTDDATLYANWTAWTNTGIEEYTLSNSAIGKIATGIDGNLSADLALAPSIYTAMSGVGMTTTSVTLPGASSATQAPCFNTNGGVKTNGYGLKFTAPANGTLTAWIGAGGGSQRNIKLTDGTDVIEPTDGSVVIGNIESARYTPVEIVYTVEEGTTYYLGGDNGVRIYYVSFEAASAVVTPTTEIYWQTGTDSNDKTDLVRVIGVIENVEDGFANIDNVTLTYTKSGADTVTTQTITTLYTAIKDGADAYSVSTPSGTVSFGAETGTYYVVFVFDGYEAFHNASKSMDITINVYANGNESPITATKTIS